GGGAAPPPPRGAGGRGCPTAPLWVPRAAEGPEVAAGGAPPPPPQNIGRARGAGRAPVPPRPPPPASPPPPNGRPRCQRGPRLHAGRVRAAVPELGCGERAVLVDHLAHHREVLDVVVVPEAGGDAVRVVRLRRDGAVLGAAGAVPALRLHRAEIRLVERFLG